MRRLSLRKARAEAAHYLWTTVEELQLHHERWFWRWCLPTYPIPRIPARRWTP